MKILKKMATRLTVTVVLLIVQIIIFALLLNGITSMLPFITIASYVISILVILILVRKDDSAAYKITWIIAVMALPISGAALYLMFGNYRPTRRIKARIEQEERLTAELLNKSGGDCQEGRAAGCLRYIREVGAYPAYANTGTKYYPFGDVMFKDMLTALRSAKRYIFLEFFIIADGEMWRETLDILMQKAESGVDVRLIYDDLGSLELFTSKYAAHLKSKKIKLVRFSPIKPFFTAFMNNRDHRKILVVDGHTGFTGGININDETIGKNDRLGIWKDTGVRLTGAAVWSLALMFIRIWNVFCDQSDRIHDYESYRSPSGSVEEGTDGWVVPYADTPLSVERLGENIYIDILSQAQKYAYIFTPYLIISEKMIYALQMAAKRGVDVRIVTPGIPDWKIVYRVTRSYYGCLMEAGVKIYEYSPGFLHAKTFVCDDEVAVVGTINLDYRSLYLHFECAALLYRTSSIQSIRDDALKTMSEGREVMPDGKRRFLSDLLDSILHLFAPIM